MNEIRTFDPKLRVMWWVHVRVLWWDFNRVWYCFNIIPELTQDLCRKLVDRGLEKRNNEADVV